MTQIQLFKKRKKKKKEFLEVGEKEEVEEQLDSRIKNAFKGHVGEDNALTPLELFKKVYNIDPNDVEFYKRVYFWNLLLKKLHDFRKNKTLFVINKATHLFVLKTQKESFDFRKRLDSTIVALGRTQDNADSWVKSKKWEKYDK